ncbi:MAG: hypothetical protein ACREL2_01285 [Gemmatimonadales bacterium]
MRRMVQEPRAMDGGHAGRAGAIGRAGAAVVLALAFGGCGGGSTNPDPYEALPTTLSTVQAAVALVTTGTATVSAQCSADIPINCPGGVAAAPVAITVTGDTNSASAVDSVTYDFTAEVSVVSQEDIPITVPAIGACSVKIDTGPGTSATIQLVGTATFGAQVAGGPLDRLDLAIVLVNGVETADFTLDGGGVCGAADLAETFYINIVTAALQTLPLHVCGAPGPSLFTPCAAKPTTISH